MKVAKNNRKKEEWQLNKIDCYTTAETNSFDLFDDSNKWSFDPRRRT